jgi:hypothetical protein
VRRGRLLAEKRGLDLNKKLIFLYTSHVLLLKLFQILAIMPMSVNPLISRRPKWNSGMA